MESKGETWIIYKTVSGNSSGWENRMLMPSEGLTDILAEEWDWSGEMPQVGDRVRDYTNLEEPGNGITHGRDGDWVVSKIQRFSSPDTRDRIVVCLCEFQPIDSQWEAIPRGKPIDAAMLAASTKAH